MNGDGARPKLRTTFDYGHGGRDGYYAKYPYAGIAHPPELGAPAEPRAAAADQSEQASAGVLPRRPAS